VEVEPVAAVTGALEAENDTGSILAVYPPVCIHKGFARFEPVKIS
jgi:hypothetical protein